MEKELEDASHYPCSKAGIYSFDYLLIYIKLLLNIPQILSTGNTNYLQAIYVSATCVF
jgi:hypothetical protein